MTLLLLSLAALGLAAAEPRSLPPLEGTVHGPVLEWQVSTRDYRGDPYDVQAFARFVHADGDAYTVPLFHAGDHAWRLRFTAPRVGHYDVVTQSRHPGLDGITTSLAVAPNPDPDASSFMVAQGDAFAVLAGDGSEARRLVYHVYQRHPSASDPAGLETPAHLSADPAIRGPHIEALLDEVEAHGKQALFLMVGNNWFSWPREYDEPVPDDEPRREYPDPVTFGIIEDLLERARARGLFVHLWAWGDSENRNSPDGFGGINSAVDVRLQYYIAGRLGSIPNWTMSLGYDLEEWVTPAEARAWHATLTGFNTLPRLIGAREFGTWRDQTFELGRDKLGYFSNDLRPESDFFEEALTLFDQGHGLPVLFERRFLHTRDGVWDQDTTRRALWQFTLAGGAGAIWGVLWGDGPPYPEPAQGRTYRDFWQARFDHAFERPTRLIDGTIALHGTEPDRAMFYAEATQRVSLDLRDARGSLPAVAVDTRAPYAEVEIGPLSASDEAWVAPYESDWVVAVGAF